MPTAPETVRVAHGSDSFDQAPRRSLTLKPGHQLSITYPEGDAQQLHQALLLLKKSSCLNVSAFCMAAIAEKLERLEQQEVV